MKNFCLIIILSWCVLYLVSCVPCRRSSKMKRHFNIRTGEVIAVDDLIKRYESEHQKFHIEETRDDTLLKWPDLDSKNLAHYCKKYLQYLVPTRKTDHATGTKMERTLSYVKENMSNSNRIVTACCTVMNKNHRNNYYITRAPEPKCVYALRLTGRSIKSNLLITHKHCDFEDQISHKRNREKEYYIGGMHTKLGQPIAKPEYLEKYELEHQELLKKERGQGKYIHWLYAMTHSNLDSFCYQYMRKCAPGRNREGVTGSWERMKLHYQKLSITEDVIVTTVKCKPPTEIRQNYHMTRALEMNCVYALLRKGHSQNFPLVIIFKYCDFEDPNDQQTLSQKYGISVENVNPKVEVKEEMNNSLGILQFFPNP